MTPDIELLRRYAKTNSEDAFAELVRRHVNLVYSAALRQVNGDAHLAQDVAQTVFTDLARKAGSLARRETLTGWLYTSAHFVAAKIARTENRRRDREEKFMREPIHEDAPGDSRAEVFAETGAEWEKLRPALDDAMHELKETDREAILLRYFENRQFAEVGVKLGLNENAARMRVERALEKLRAVFSRRGVATTAALASVISANAIQLAPANLAATLVTASIAAAGTGIFTLVKIMTATKLKLGISAIVIASAATVLVVQHQAQEKLRGENDSLQQQIAQLQADNEGLSNRLATTGDSKSLSDEQFNELLKLRGEVGMLRQQTNELGKLRAPHIDPVQNFQPSEENVSAKEQDKQTAIAKMDDAKSYLLGFIMYAQDNQGHIPTNFDQIASYLTNAPSVPTGTNSFDLVYHGSLDGLANPNAIILIQESQAWQTSSGRWHKTYGFADGHSEVFEEPYDDFSTFEQQHTLSPPPNQ